MAGIRTDAGTDEAEQEDYDADESLAQLEELVVGPHIKEDSCIALLLNAKEWPKVKARVIEATTPKPKSIHRLLTMSLRSLSSMPSESSVLCFMIL